LAGVFRDGQRFSDHPAQHFAPFTPIAVSPIRISDFIRAAGIKVLYSEAIRIWMPMTLIAAADFGIRKRTS